ncbi:carbohydrate ABC transporter permease [Diplocloster agilis]|uniref:Carbohydrate ABC transporter permease n=1 Tax=Diplocloster agilis TaxID=2850323 RepID=A0A949JUZ6_9FIRM|nr:MULTISPECIES: carbohydrate ABC transporter permease [Lachnospiraceae]MBU9735623.1 carbohydrate ABC transporter permease [Diplocloster agilis]MCU6732361.1 carbohydrate ABC transporter permease [Suonthocola fibrivorans]SCI44471.1 Inner membrane ABC transporter permease protein ycjP [uncultured Clostridium sp.]
MRQRQMNKRVLFVVILFILLLFMIPFFILILNTFKPTAEFTRNPFSWPAAFNLDNYRSAIDTMKFWSAFKNTAVITVLATVLNTLLASMTGYFFSRKKWRINSVLFMLLLASMVAPFQVYMIPLVKLYGGLLGMSNRIITVVYVAAGLNVPFAVFLYHGFVSGIPRELDEAAEIDGCGFTRTFFEIIFPLLKPIMITVMVFVALAVWNDYLMTSLFMTKIETRTLAIAAFAFLTNHTADYSPMMAGLVLGIIPVLVFYLFGQKYIIEGVVAGSVKG